MSATTSSIPSCATATRASPLLSRSSLKLRPNSGASSTVRCPMNARSASGSGSPSSGKVAVGSESPTSAASTAVRSEATEPRVTSAPSSIFACSGLSIG
ncbi:MAG: hypothetical protein U0269_08950 [Polyangiales bacterium]